MTDPTRILIFGQSNTGGVQLADRQAAWPNLVASALPELTGQPVEITVRPFFAHAPGSEDYLERELRRREPDIVFVTLSSFSFLNPVIEPGVRERFGERMGNVYHAFATRLDELTRDRGRLAVTLNRSGRAVARRVFGAAPVTTYEVAVEGTTKALQLLARQEDIQVVAVHGFVKLENRRSGLPSQKEVVLLRFLDEMRTLTGRLRITFINLQEGSVPDTRFLPDGLRPRPPPPAAPPAPPASPARRPPPAAPPPGPGVPGGAPPRVPRFLRPAGASPGGRRPGRARFCSCCPAAPGERRSVPGFDRRISTVLAERWRWRRRGFAFELGGCREVALSVARVPRFPVVPPCSVASTPGAAAGPAPAFSRRSGILA
ncbi:MAG: hypothetical protein IPH65_07910 [Dehalococcoidia bacterium]|uniref:hypothetical protein n=1 Tax=Candidatus Amarobacter glycogenicus TaxID=3140699 RepID=UPI003134E9CD|nr:hypothetical protein [Dehalococcoidia bacterium]